MSFNLVGAGAILRRGAHKSAIMLVCAGMVLSSCETMPSAGLVQADASDSCSNFRQTIGAARRTEIDNVVASAAVGALLGGVVTAIRDGSREDILRNAAIGGLAGASLSYYKQKRDRMNDAQVLQSVNQDAGNERRILSQTGAAADGLRKCRLNQIAALEKKVKAGSIERGAAKAEIATLRRRVAADNQVITQALDGVGNRVNLYVDASAAAGQVDSAIVTAERAARTAAAQRARAATPNVRSARTALATEQRDNAADQTRLERRLASLELLVG